MNFTPKTLKILGIIITGASCAILGFIITYNWRNEKGLPEWMILIPIFLPLLAFFLIRQSKK